jgi:hypothetical protein
MPKLDGTLVAVGGSLLKMKALVGGWLVYVYCFVNKDYCAEYAAIEP